MIIDAIMFLWKFARFTFESWCELLASASFGLRDRFPRLGKLLDPVITVGLLVCLHVSVACLHIFVLQTTVVPGSASGDYWWTVMLTSIVVDVILIPFTVWFTLSGIVFGAKDLCDRFAAAGYGIGRAKAMGQAPPHSDTADDADTPRIIRRTSPPVFRTETLGLGGGRFILKTTVHRGETTEEE